LVSGATLRMTVKRGWVLAKNGWISCLVRERGLARNSLVVERGFASEDARVLDCRDGAFGARNAAALARVPEREAAEVSAYRLTSGAFEH